MDTLITELGVWEFDKASREMTLTEIAPKIDLDYLKEKTPANYKVAPNLKSMEDA